MTADSEWDSASRAGSAGVHVVLYPDTAVGAVHPRQGDRRRQHEGLCGFGELLDREPRLQPRAGPHHFIGRRSRAAEQRALRRCLGRTAVPGGRAPLAIDHALDFGADTASPTTAGCTPIDDEGGCYSRANTAGTTITGRPVGPATVRPSPVRMRTAPGTGRRRSRFLGSAVQDGGCTSNTEAPRPVPRLPRPHCPPGVPKQPTPTVQSR